jgi:uncharacterized OB-fold protein
MKPHIGKKCRDAVQIHHQDEKVFYFDEDGKRLRNPNKYIAKQVLTLKCLWCGREMSEYRVICPHCNNCQYCGFYSPALNQCLHCGNQAPEELKIRPERLNVRELKRQRN